MKNQRVICKDLKACNSFLDRSLGLLLKSNPRNLLFKTRFGIHTFFLDKPIDVLVLNYRMKVVALKRQLAPNRCFFWNPEHERLIELEAGSIKDNNIKIGNVLKLLNN